MKDLNFYQQLEVSTDANPEEIKRAHRKMALRWHPDKNKDNEKEAEEKFKLIQKAYEYLINPQKRLEYDYKMGFRTRPTQHREKTFDWASLFQGLAIAAALIFGIILIAGAVNSEKRR